MSTTPLLYQNITSKVQEELLRFQDAKNLLNIFPSKVTDNNTLVELIWRYLGDVGQASLSSALWDPTKVKHDIATLAMKRYSTGIEKRLPYEDWKILLQMGNVYDANIQQIIEKPGIQGTHYFFQGKKLRDDYTQGNPPDTAQYNFGLDVGANALASTLTRPIGCNQVTGTPNTWQATAGAWSTYANLNTDLSNLIAPLGEKGFDKRQTVVFYPENAEGAMLKKRSTAGDGHRNAFQELEDLGISRERVIPMNDVFGYTRAGAVPARTAFDLVAIDRSSVRIFYTEAPFVNIYMDQSGTKYPGMTIEAGMAFCPIFIPNYRVADSKYYKGVTVIRGINGA